MSLNEEIYVFLQSIITVITVIISFLIAIWKMFTQLSEASKSQRDHDQQVLDQLVGLVKNVAGGKNG